MFDMPETDATHLGDATIEVYRELPYEFSRRLSGAFFCRIAGGQLPLVFNCAAAGKDRTGVAAALPLTALGVAWEDVMADYLLSGQIVADILRAFRCTKHQTPGIQRPDFIAALYGSRIS
jgi:hypothetical protein